MVVGSESAMLCQAKVSDHREAMRRIEKLQKKNYGVDDWPDVKQSVSNKPPVGLNQSGCVGNLSKKQIDN